VAKIKVVARDPTSSGTSQTEQVEESEEVEPDIAGNKLQRAMVCSNAERFETKRTDFNKTRGKGTGKETSQKPQNGKTSRAASSAEMAKQLDRITAKFDAHKDKFASTNFWLGYHVSHDLQGNTFRTSDELIFYHAISEKKLGILQTPDATAAVQAHIRPGEVFATKQQCLEQKTQRFYYKLADGRGWVAVHSRKDPNKVCVDMAPPQKQIKFMRKLGKIGLAKLSEASSASSEEQDEENEEDDFDDQESNTDDSDIEDRQVQHTRGTPVRPSIFMEPTMDRSRMLTRPDGGGGAVPHDCNQQ